MRSILACALFLSLSGCLGSRDGATSDSLEDRAGVVTALASLEQRALTDTRANDPDLWDGPRGGDPVRIRRLRGAEERVLVLLSDPGELRLYDAAWTLRASLAVLPGSASWAFVAPNDLFVASPRSASVLRVQVIGDSLRALGEIDFGDSLETNPTLGLRDLAFDDETQTLFAIDFVRDRLLQRTIAGSGGAASALLTSSTKAGPLSLTIAGRRLIVASLLGHSIEVLSLNDTPPSFRASVLNDGPVWSVAATVVSADTTWIAAGGIENRPLDRTAEEFGYVDSYLFLYRLGRSQLYGVDAVNLSSLGIVTPKHLVFDENHTLWVSGFGGARIAAFRVSSRRLHVVDTWAAPPGIAQFEIETTAAPRRTGDLADDSLTTVDATRSAAGENTGTPSAVLAVNPLLDCVQRIEFDATGGGAIGLTDRGVRDLDRPNGERERVEPSGAPEAMVFAPLVDFAEPDRPFSDRLGEILLYTDLLAPQNTTEGSLSRFSCEACHFEGAVDGRIHFTGRGEIHATTKPLFGLLDNVPLFSRATTPDLASMVPAEFDVANQHRRAWRPIERAAHPWLGAIGAPEEIDPLMQRTSLLAFLARWDAPPPAERLRHEAFTTEELRGLEMFRDRCASCHLPIRTTRDEGAVVPFEQWPRCLPEGTMIWGAPFRMKTGVEPYPAPEGTRVPSLRRVSSKRPYFTNGSAADLETLLREFRFRGSRSWHAQGPSSADSLHVSEIHALKQVLERF